MIGTFDKIKQLTASGDVPISEHGYDELAEDGLSSREIIGGIENTILIEDYPAFPKGPAVLLLQRGKDGQAVHAVWGTPKREGRPAVLVTAYRPDPARWDDSYMERRQ